MSQIRILHVVTIMNRGGIETMIMNYYRKIDRSKIQFDFLVHRTEVGFYEKEIESLGGRIYRVSPIRFTHLWKYHAELDAFFSKHRYALVHCHLDALSYLPLSVAKKHKVQTRIAHSHCNNFDIDAKYPIRTVLKKMIPLSATHFFACSSEAGNFMFGKRPFKILKNAIDIERYAFDEGLRFEKRNELGLDNEFVIGHVGRFFPAKNHRFILDIFEELLDRNPQSKLVLVGEGPLKNEIMADAKKRSLSSQIQFLGGRSDIPQLLMAFDAFILPSNYEGLGIAAIEAQATGLHCLLSSRVSKEVALIPEVSFLEIDSTQPWVDGLVAISTLPSHNINASGRVQEAGYDIASCALELSDFYIKWGMEK